MNQTERKMLEHWYARRMVIGITIKLTVAALLTPPLLIVTPDGTVADLVAYVMLVLWFAAAIGWAAVGVLSMSISDAEKLTDSSIAELLEDEKPG